MLQFSSFKPEDAWHLGQMFVEEAIELHLPIAINIRLLSGQTLFSCALSGTSLDNEAWIERKFNTVKRFGMSTLAYALLLKSQGFSLKDRGLDPQLYVNGGGGFPLVVDSAGCIGSAMVSGLSDLEDHRVLVRCLARYLQRSNVPYYPLD